MQRRALIAALLLALVWQVPATAAPVVKPGTKCSKAGVITSANNLKFTCVKKGKLLVWSAGVKIVKANPSPSPSASPAISTKQSFSPTPTPTSTTNNLSISKAVVATHSNKADCWSYVDSKVYNFTLWIKEHPGGEDVVISMCGGNGAEILRGHHGVEVDSYLVPYFIGNLS